MSKVFTANRLAALASWSTGTAAVVLAFVGVFPHGWQNTELAVAGLLKSGATVLMFLRGSQQYDKLTHASASNEAPKSEPAQSPGLQEADQELRARGLPAQAVATLALAAADRSVPMPPLPDAAPDSEADPDSEIEPDSELARAWLQGPHEHNLEHAGFPDPLEQPAEPVTHPSELVKDKAVEQL